MFTLAVLPFPNIDPVIFSIGPFAVRWYALAYIVGLIFGVWYMKRLVSSPKLWEGTTPSATPAQIDDFFLWAVLGVVLGGRVGYLLFYGWTLACSLIGYVIAMVGGLRALLFFGPVWIKGTQYLEEIILGLGHTLEGKENLPPAPYIVACQHQSAWETILLPVWFPRCAIVLR